MLGTGSIWVPFESYGPLLFSGSVLAKGRGVQEVGEERNNMGTRGIVDPMER